MDVVIREYSDKDLKFLKESFEKLHDYVISIDPIKRIRKMPGYLDCFFNNFLKTLKDNYGMVYIAIYDGIPVGFVGGFIANKQTKENLLEVIPSQLGIVSDIYIQNNYRGRGIGKSLMDKIELYLFNKNCDSLWVNTNSFNTNALNLYRSAGFSEREVGLYKRISPLH